MNTVERIAAAERQMASLQADLRQTARVATSFGDCPLRIAKITNDPGDDDNVFDVVFVDGTFPEYAGDHDVTWRERQQTAKDVICNLADEKIPQDKYVWAFRHARRWWTWYTEGGGESTPSTDEIKGIQQSFTSELTDIFHHEQRWPPWNHERIWGSADGCTWDEEHHVFVLAAHEWLITRGMSGFAQSERDLYEPRELWTDEINSIVTRLYERPAPWDDDDEWQMIDGSYFSIFAPREDIINSGSRQSYHRFTQTRCIGMDVTCGNNHPSFADYATCTHLWINFRRLNFG